MMFPRMQRRRTAEDEINMRTIFQEGDLISVRIRASSCNISTASQPLGAG